MTNLDFNKGMSMVNPGVSPNNVKLFVLYRLVDVIE